MNALSRSSLSLSWATVTGCLSLVACEPAPSVPTLGDLEIEISNPSLELDRSDRAGEATLYLEVSAQFAGEATDTTLSATRIELVGPGGTVSEGLELVHSDGAATSPELFVPVTGAASLARITGLTNAAADALCDGVVRVEITLAATHCGCESTVAFEVTPRCTLDNRGADILALPRAPAADRPCRSALTLSGRTSYQYFGYDEEGRVEIVDDFFETEHRARRVYRYRPDGWLSESLSVEVASETVFARATYEYVEGVLARVTRDGWVDVSTTDPDGVVDAETTFTLGANRWDIRTELRNTGRSAVGAMTFDLEGRMFSGMEPGEPSITYAFDASATDPNVLVAVGSVERTLRLRLRSATGAGDVQTYEWSGDRIVAATATSADGMTATTTFDYECP